MGGAYKDDEATRVDASTLRHNQSSDAPPPIPPAEASQETQRIRLEDVDRRALPFKRKGGRRGPPDPEDIAELAETGAMHPVQDPVIPFPDSKRELDGVPSTPPSSGPSPPDRPKYPPTSLRPLHENPLAQSAWSQDVSTELAPQDLPSSLAPPPEAPALQAMPIPAENTTSVVIIAVVALVLIAGAAVLLL